MFAGQKPDPSWPYALPAPDDPGRSLRPTESVGAMPNRGSPAFHSHTLPLILATVLGLAALAAVGVVGSLMLRPAGPVKAAAPAALPQLASSASPALSEEAASSAGETSVSERLSVAAPAPIQYGVTQQASLEAPPSATPSSALGTLPQPPAIAELGAPMPPSRPLTFAPLEFAPTEKSAASYDKWTAVYDISAHSVYLPDGTRLEAHSGLGDRLDDPRFVDERDRGATPPNLYELTLRESLFHGVQALRLTPIGQGLTFDRVGLLAHPYMLGPSGDSNGCVSFRNYDAFLRAFQSGAVKHLLVVARLTQDPAPPERLAILRFDQGH